MWHVTLLPPDAILGYKCTQNAFADPAGGAYSAPPDPLAVFEGPLRGREGERNGGKGEGREMDPRNYENRSRPMQLITVEPFVIDS